MSDDPKLDFYLENRALIEEWAKLRDPALAALDRELLEAARLTEGDDVPKPQFKEGPARSVMLHVTPDPLAWLELWWQKGTLLTGSGSWPKLAIVMDPSDPRRNAVKDATGSAAKAHGMTSTGSRAAWWLRSGEIPPQTEPIVIEEYAEYCVQRLRDAWLGLHATIRQAVETTTPLS
jgi:hypothetical protein